MVRIEWALPHGIQTETLQDAPRVNQLRQRSSIYGYHRHTKNSYLLDRPRFSLDHSAFHHSCVFEVRNSNRDTTGNAEPIE